MNQTFATDAIPATVRLPGRVFFDTAGCSCEQIVDEAGLGKGHLMFGCSIGEMEAWVEFIDSL